MQFAKMTPSEGQTYSKMISLVDGMVSILDKIESDVRRFSKRIQEMDKERKHLRIDRPYSWMTQLHQTRSVFRNEDVIHINKNPAARVSRAPFYSAFGGSFPASAEFSLLLPPQMMIMCLWSVVCGLWSVASFHLFRASLVGKKSLGHFIKSPRCMYLEFSPFHM
jgi:hypothetical protein